MDSFESPTENGTWDANTTNHISVGYSTSNATLGSHSLQVGVTVAGGCNMTNWYNFDPARWTNVTKVVMDLTADASLCTGGTYYQLQMVGQSSSNGKYWAPITVPTSITAGSQSVTFAIDWTQGNMTPADLISNIVFVWNTDGTGTGNMYFDNVRLVGTTTACPPTTCGLMDSFESPTENGTWDANTTNHISVSYSTSNATLGSHSLQVAVTVAGGCNMANWYNFVPARWLGATQVVMDLTADASLCTGGTYYQLQMVGQSSSNNKYWAPITIPTGITAGSQSVTFAIDWTQGNMLPADLFSNIVFVWNTDGTGIGNMYFDNVRIYNGSSCHP
jgi:hypothetical protein